MAKRNKQGRRIVSLTFSSDWQNDPKREHYLGNSVNAPVGRWQNGRDVNWYNKDKGEDDKDGNAAREKRRAELAQLKRAESEALSSVL